MVFKVYSVNVILNMLPIKQPIMQLDFTAVPQHPTKLEVFRMEKGYFFW